MSEHVCQISPKEFGQIVPKVSPATENQSISSNLLHKKDHSRIRYQRVSEATGKEVPAEEIVCGYEVERDNFVVFVIAHNRPSGLHLFRGRRGFRPLRSDA